MIVSILLIGHIPQAKVVSDTPAKAQFVLASWDYPDEYGQGIDLFGFYENSTGSWLSYGDAYEPDQSYTIDWNNSVFIKLRCYAFFNSTLTGAIDVADGKNYLRHRVNVTSLGTSVFSQQNFTYYSNSTILAPMWYYGYEVVLNFLPIGGEIYTVTVDYEIFYDSEESTELDSDTSPTWGGIWKGEGSDGSVDNIFYSVADENDDEDGAIETGITVSNDLGTVTFNLDLTITAYNEQCDSIDITVMLWSGVGSGSEEIVYSDSLSGTGAVNISGSTSLATIESFLVNITYVGIISGDYVNMTIDSYFVGLLTDYDWFTISSPILLFSVSFDMWGFDTGLIILGLVMIPVSTIYLAYGAKHDRSSDRLFYGLIIFFLGCGLFIGGVLP